MAFKAISDVSGKHVAIKMQASTTINKNSGLGFAAGYLVPATNASTSVRYIALEGKTSAAGETPEILVVRADDGVMFEADTSTNTSQAIVGTRVDLTDDLTLNVGASANAVFEVESIKGLTTDNKVIGRFVTK